MGKKLVGLFRPLRFEDLDLTAKLLSSYSIADAFDILDDKLAQDFEGKEGRRKLINNLTKVWGNGKKVLPEFNQKVVDEYLKSSHEDRVIIQYLMMYRQFPFFTDVARLTGNILRMTDGFSSKPIMNEIYGMYGTTVTVNKGASSALGTMVNWDIIARADGNGKYFYDESKLVVRTPLQMNLLVDAVLSNSEHEYVSTDAINETLGLFPLEYTLFTTVLDDNMFEVLHERTERFVKLKK